MPPDGAVMVNAVDMLKSRAPAPGEPPILYGMPLPAAINAVIGIADAPYLDLMAEFKTDAPASSGRRSGRRSSASCARIRCSC